MSEIVLVRSFVGKDGVLVSCSSASKRVTASASLQDWQSYATGVALASPFLEKSIGWTGAFPFLVPWLVLTLWMRPKLNGSLISFLFLGLVVWHTLSHLIAPTDFSHITHRDSLVVLLLIFIASTVQEREGRQSVLIRRCGLWFVHCHYWSGQTSSSRPWHSSWPRSEMVSRSVSARVKSVWGL